jgi:phytol kinase
MNSLAFSFAYEISPPPWPALIWVALYLGTLISIAETLNRFFDHHGEVTRKIVHIGSGQVVLFAWWLNIPAWVGIAAAVLAAIIAILSYFLPILPSLESVGRRSLGTFFYALSIGLLIGYFFPLQHPEYAALGILIMAWGDGLAALVGQNFGQHPYQLWGTRKTWEGSLAMLIVSFGITLLILGSLQGMSFSITAIAALVGVVATILETFSRFGIDNLTVPLGSAILAFSLSRLIL